MRPKSILGPVCVIQSIFPFQDEIGEKYASCGDSIDQLLGKLRGSREDLVQRLIGSGDAVDGPGGPSNDFKAGVALVQVRFHSICIVVT